jgi:DNA polymerase III subunit delta
MGQNTPVVYVLHGEDEFAIAQFLADLTAKLGDSANAVMNTTYLDGRTLAFDDLVNATSVQPFLAKRRLVILANPLAMTANPSIWEKFIVYLDRIPETSALVLVENSPINQKPQQKRSNEAARLLEWVKSAGDRAFLRYFSLPRDGEMARWIQKRANELGGQFTREASSQLASLVGEDTRLADQEIQKLLTYVNFKRTVDGDDINLLTPFEAKLKDFALVNALREKNAAQALSVLRRQLENDDPLSILGGVIYQFRLLLLAREVLDDRGSIRDVVARLVSMFRVKEYPARLAAAEAQRFTLPTLEEIYRQLLRTDSAIKSGDMDGELALEVLVSSLTI